MHMRKKTIQPFRTFVRKTQMRDTCGFIVPWTNKVIASKHVTLACWYSQLAGDIKIMASPERVCSWVDVRKDPHNHLQTAQIPDENTLLSPGEVLIMRNHSKMSSKLYSPSRKTSKAKTFTIHGSPQRSTKMVKLNFCFIPFFEFQHLSL
jgi:hypothetical protein